MENTEVKTTEDIRNQLVNIAITDALNASRTNDAIREALMSALVKKSDDMEGTEIINAIKEVDSISSVEKAGKILSLIDKNTGSQ